MTVEVIKPSIEYRILEENGSCYPQYKGKSWFSIWKYFGERKYDGRDGERFDSTIRFNKLEDARIFVEKEIERRTVSVYKEPYWENVK